MDVFDLYAKITLDSREYDDAMDRAGDKAKDTGEKMSSAGDQASIFSAILQADLVKKGISMAIDAFKELGKVAVDTVKQAIANYSEYEQMVGGIKALFKTSSDEIFQYAEDAYKDAGLSANQYMELASSFSGALIKGTGRGVQKNLDEMESALDEEYKKTKRYLEDQYNAYKKLWDDKISLAKNETYKKTLQNQRDEELKELKRSHEDQLEEVKKHNKELLAEAEATNMQSVTTEESLAEAAKLTQLAIVDMADQANMYGKTVEEVSQTYSSLSRGIYSTLVNLFGGMFAGTKSGLQELLDYAENYRAGLGETVTYSIDSYADIVSAIHDVSEALGVAGTTSEEAEKTLEGSANRMKSAWQNLLTGIAEDNADLDKLVKEFIDSAEKYVDNLAPVIERAISNLIEIVIEMLPKFVDLGMKVGGAILKGFGEGLFVLLLTPAKPLLKWLMELDGSSYSGVDTTHRANGGFMQAGKLYKAGEFGEELVVPAQDSYAYTARETANMGNKTFIFNIGEVYDDPESMKKKLSSAVVDIIETELAYG